MRRWLSSVAVWRIVVRLDAFFGVIAATAFGDVASRARCRGHAVGQVRMMAPRAFVTQVLMAETGCSCGRLIRCVRSRATHRREEVVSNRSVIFHAGRYRHAVEVEKTEGFGKAGAKFEELDKAAAVSGFWVKRALIFDVDAHHATQGLRPRWW